MAMTIIVPYHVWGDNRKRITIGELREELARYAADEEIVWDQTEQWEAYMAAIRNAKYVYGGPTG